MNWLCRRKGKAQSIQCVVLFWFHSNACHCYFSYSCYSSPVNNSSLAISLSISFLPPGSRCQMPICNFFSPIPISWTTHTSFIFYLLSALYDFIFLWFYLISDRSYRFLLAQMLLSLKNSFLILRVFEKHAPSGPICPTLLRVLFQRGWVRAPESACLSWAQWATCGPACPQVTPWPVALLSRGDLP